MNTHYNGCPYPFDDFVFAVNTLNLSGIKLALMYANFSPLDERRTPI
jgi:hypothetical protein